MASSGPHAYGTISDDSAVGTLAWTNPSNAAADDSSYATAGSTTVVTTYYLKFLNPNPGLPAGTVDSISIAVNRKASHDGARHVHDSRVSLVFGGGVQAENDADTGTDWPTTDGDKTYNTWTTLPTVAQANASDFGFVLSVEITAAVSTTTASVDYASITFTYTASGGGSGLTTRKMLLGVGI